MAPMCCWAAPFNTDELVDIAAQIEGHPDNTTPALLGGIVTAAFSEGKHVYWTKQEIYRHLDFYAVVPDFELSTEKARACLPKTVSHEDARYNLARAALFSASLLQGKYENLRIAVHDRLHQPFRMKLIPHSHEVFEQSQCSLGSYAAYVAAPALLCEHCLGGKRPVPAGNAGFLDAKWATGWPDHPPSIDNQGTHVVL